MTSRRAVAYGSPVSAMRSRAAALILSCDIVPLLRWPRPGAWPPHIGDHDGKGKTPREGWAALVLRHYHQRRAGVARIRQTWLPSLSIRQLDGHSRRPAVYRGGAPRTPNPLLRGACVCPWIGHGFLEPDLEVVHDGRDNPRPTRPSHR